MHPAGRGLLRRLVLPGVALLLFGAWLTYDYEAVVKLQGYTSVLQPARAFFGLTAKAEVPNAHCPYTYTRPTLKGIADGDEPFIFGKRPRLEGAPGDDEGQVNWCSYNPWGAPMCSQEDQDKLKGWLLERAQRGATNAAGTLTMTPCDLFELIYGRTLWLVGDSMTQEHQRAMQCFFKDFWDLKTPPPTEDPAVLEEVEKEAGVRPWCAHLVNNTRVCHVRSNRGNHVAQFFMPQFAALGGSPHDIVVDNFGVWFNDDQEELFGHITLFEQYMREHMHEAWFPFFVWRETSVQHFDTPLGFFKGAPHPYECKPIAHVELHHNNTLTTSHPDWQEIVEGGWRNRHANKVMQDLGIPIIHTWNESVPLWFLHRNYQAGGDCTHTCHPSFYELWIWNTYHTLLGLQERLAEHDRRVEAAAKQAAAGPRAAETTAQLLQAKQHRLLLQLG